MWFKELYELWKKDNSLTEAYNDSYQMLLHTHEMYQESIKSLRQSDRGELNLDVYEKDRLVNKYIREVRRKILKYLAVTGGMNIIPGLILTSIVIDIERVGDYMKNITDLTLAHPKMLYGGDFEDDFKKIEQAVDEVYQELLPAFKTSDKAAASRLIADKYWVVKRCDEIVMSFIRDENAAVNSRDAASRTLYARYLKRITAHLLNIASSIVNPFEHIGFHNTDGDGGKTP